MRHIAIAILLAAAAFGAGCDEGESETSPQADGGDTDDTDPGVLQPGDLVHGLNIVGLSLYQAVEIPILVDGEIYSGETVPMVLGREAFLRVFVERQGDWQPHSVTLRVDLRDGDEELDPLNVQRNITADSTQKDLDSTFNVSIPADQVTEGLELSLSLREPIGGLEPSGTADLAVWPQSGMHQLAPGDTGEPLRLVVVPYQYFKDEYVFMPDTGTQQIYRYVQTLDSQYPVKGVEITVADPREWHQPVLSNGTGWAAILNDLVGLRYQNGASAREYYYALINPGADFIDYCSGSCVAGMSALCENPSDSWARVSSGVGFSGQEAADTMVHEIGHAHGRSHAPCGVTDPDPAYPHGGGLIGAWGYDTVSGEMVDPAFVYDFMSYCNPTWVSDYTYEGLFERVQAVNALPGKGPKADGEEHIWRSLAVLLDGTVVAGPDILAASTPTGRERAVELLDASGAQVDVATGHFQPYSEPPAGLVVFPDPPEGVTAARIEGSLAVPIPGAKAE